MYTEPEIVSSTNLKVRAYIYFYFNGEPVKEYTGNRTHLRIFPNRAKTYAERERRLSMLRTEILRCLSSGEYPVEKKPAVSERTPLTDLTVREVLDQVLTNKLAMKLSQRYKDDLSLIHKQFTEDFLTSVELGGFLNDLSLSRIQQFLLRFSSSGTYYMRRRSDLSILLNAACRQLRIPSFTKDIQTVKAKARLHEPYTNSQVKNLLKFLATYNTKLYVCCLLTYSSWLRPHVEIRNLKGSHFKNGNSEIHLSGDENKGGRVRIVYVPEYARKGISLLLEGLDPELNFFKRTPEPYNEDYFSTLWGRVRPILLSEGLIKPNQTIYSFRHTAAIEVYRRTKDIYLLQKLLGHSSTEVTQKYLRGLGEVDITELKNAAPRL